MSKKPFSDLTPQQRLLILGMMEDGIHKGLRMLCENKAHQMFVQSLHGGPPFDPIQVWESYPPGSQSHFADGTAAIQAIVKLREAAHAEIDAQERQPAPTPIPEPTPRAAPKSPTKKKRPNKKRGGK